VLRDTLLKLDEEKISDAEKIAFVKFKISFLISFLAGGLIIVQHLLAAAGVTSNLYQTPRRTPPQHDANFPRIADNRVCLDRHRNRTR
jgi:hypothetical protein